LIYPRLRVFMLKLMFSLLDRFLKLMTLIQEDSKLLDSYSKSILNSEV